MANMSNGFYMGQQGFATSGTTNQSFNTGYGAHMYQANATSTSQPPVVTQSVNYGYGGSGQVGYSGYTQFDHSSQGQTVETGTSYGQAQPVRRGRGRGRGYHRGGHVPTGPKQIKATEIKAFIYAWCGQMKRKPEYTYETIGSFPRVTYKCTVNVHGYPSAECEAKSKKDAQTLTAWAFSDKLVEMGHVKEHELPPRPECTVKTNETNMMNEAKIGIIDTDEANPAYGGWTAENSRPRLNRFCMMERISCDFQNHSEGPCHKKVSISTLEFNIERASQRPLRVSVRASNKKTANSQCAKEMIRLLFKEGLIERYGDKIKQKEPESSDQQAGQKRKISGEMGFDSNGNWTLETAKARLSKFYQQHQMDFQAALACDEIGHPPHRQYQCQFQVDLEGQSFHSCVVADNKKTAQRKASLDMVIKLYRANLIDGNRGDRFGIYASKRGRGMSRGVRGGGPGRGAMTHGAAIPPPNSMPSMVPPVSHGFKPFATM